MSFFSNLFKSKQPKYIRLTSKNINQWPTFLKLLNEGKIKFDKVSRLRYLHGAPVGDLILSGNNEDGTPKFRESADDWFDPESKKAKEFMWP